VIAGIAVHGVALTLQSTRTAFIQKVLNLRQSEWPRHLSSTSFSKTTGVACVPTFATTLSARCLVADQVPRDLPFQRILAIESGVESNNSNMETDNLLGHRGMSGFILDRASEAAFTTLESSPSAPPTPMNLLRNFLVSRNLLVPWG
jgi:hypothetical protein